MLLPSVVRKDPVNFGVNMGYCRHQKVRLVQVSAHTAGQYLSVGNYNISVRMVEYCEFDWQPSPMINQQRLHKQSSGRIRLRSINDQRIGGPHGQSESGIHLSLSFTGHCDALCCF